jgi:hypothetical protein
MVLLPFSAMVIGFALAIVILNHYLAAPARRTHELIWGVSFILFGAGAAFELAADLWGWNDWLVRLYYISGAILAVALLGLGEAILLAPRWRTALLVVTGLFSLLTIGAVFMQPINAAELAGSAPWKAVGVSGSLPLILAAVSNSLGTLLIVGGALYSAWIFWRKHIQFHRMIGCVLLAVGTLVVASGGTVARVFDAHAWLYPPMAVGVAIMFIGYLETTRAVAPAAVPAPNAQPVTPDRSGQ